MNVNLKVLTAGALFFMGGQAAFAQKKDSSKVKNIEEVVVVAYGTQTKESLTGSVGEVKAKALKEITAPNVIQGMIGKVAGVQISSVNGLPGTAPVVRFRGIGSINGSSAPLYVVDGVPFNGDIAAINNQDIESTSFLKDASAAALYGNRGANGVIVITTKKGAKGKLRLTLDSKVGMAERGLAEYNLIQDPARYYEAYHRFLKNNYIYAGDNATVAHTKASNELVSASGLGLGYNITNVPGAQIIGADGNFNPAASILYRENWADYLFKRGVYTNTYLSASGASDNTTYFFSGGYESNDTYMVNSKFEKVTLRGKTESKLGDRLKLGTNLAYTNMVQNAPDGFDGSTAYSNPFQWTRSIAPIYPVYAYDATGKPVYLANGERAYDDGTGKYSPFVRPYGSIQHPYATALLDIKKNVTNQIFANAYATYKILNGLNFTYNVTGEFSNTRNQSLDTSLYGDAVSVNGRLYNTNQNTTSVTHQQLLTYDKKFNNFGLQVLAGHETLDRQFDYMQTHVINGILVDSPYSDQFGIVNGISGYGSPYATEGYFARLNMDYAGKYFINANFRRDGSSRFHPDNRWGSFYGIGGAWIASKENFLSNVSWLNNLKFKASYGEQGNDNLGYNFPYLNQYSVVQTTNAAETTISMNQTFKGNKDITWEKNANLNVGFEVDLFNNRLSIDAEYFNRKSFDMLFMKPLPISEGFSSVPENIGDMVNRGVEVTAKFDVVRSENYKFTVNANTTYLENEILKLSQPEIVDGSYLLKPGNSRYTWRMREFVGVNSTNGAALFAVVNPTTGARTSTSTYASGTLIDTGKSAVPKFYGGFGFDFNVYKFDLGVNFAYQLGGWGYDSNWMTLMAMGERGRNVHTDYTQTWTNVNTIADLPVIIPNNPQNFYSTSSMGFIKSDYLSLQNVSLGYTTSKGLLDKLGVNSLRVYVLADNIHVWSARKGYDPRLSLTGVSSSNYAPIRTVSFGINASF